MADASTKIGRNGQQTQELPLIATKLYIPPARPGPVPRPRLTQRLNEGLRSKLILLSAPAGSGKTTLLNEWRTTPPASDLPCAWLSLDEGDNDPTRFWAYVIAALQRVHPDVSESILAAFRSPQAPPPEVFLPPLINNLAALTGDFVLVLDDYHVIRQQEIHQAITFLLEHLPPPVHLVITSRRELPLPLSLLRGRGQLLELQADDLRFTPQEARDFLLRVMGLGLTAEQMAVLMERTEGWIAGLQMAALSLRGKEDIAGFVQAFRGDDRHILDYLVEQVLTRQTEEMQSFLLQTAILNRMCAPLCDAVTGQPQGQAMLEMLERSNLFVIPLDNKRQWYRYHHLFADVLRHRLQQTHAEQVPELHRRAAAWLERNGLEEEAIPHALAAADFVKAADLIERVVETLLIQRYEMATALSWLQALPDALLYARLPLRYWYFFALADVATDTDILDRLTQDAEALLEQAETEADFDRILQLACGRVSFLGWTGDLAQAVQLAERTLRRLPAGYLIGQRAVRYRISLGMAYYDNGDMRAAEREYLEAGQYVDLPHYAGTSWPDIQRLRGALRQAATIHRQAFADPRGVSRSPYGAIGLARFADICYEWNDLAGAVEHLQQAVAILEEWRLPRLQAEASWQLAQAYQTQGEAARAADAAERALSAAREASESSLQRIAHRSLRALQAQFWLAQGRLDEANQWAAACGLSLADDPAYQRLGDYLTLARVALARGESAAALPLLARLRQQAEVQGRMRDALQVMALQAVALQATGRVEAALTTLMQMLAHAEPEGYIRTFVDAGESMAQLLRLAAKRHMYPSYVARLLAAFGEPTETTPPQAAALVEPLSEREREVLRLLAAGRQSPEIARTLTIAVSTVRSHLKSIYGKLDVHNRTEAVERARTLQLL